MSPRSWFRHSVQIARIEWTRSRRQRDRVSALRAGLVVVVFCFSGVGGIGAYSIGRAIHHGHATLSLGGMQVAATVGFLMLLWQFAQQTSAQLERINTDLLLTTVPAREVILGVMFFVYSRVAGPLSLPLLCVAGGFALGTQSLASALFLIIAVTGFLALAALIGVGLSLATELATTRSPRLRRYLKRFPVVAFVLLLVVWTQLVDGSVPIDLLLRFLGDIPSAWFVDLGLLGTSGVQSDFLRGIGALGLLGGGSPLLMVIVIVLAKHIWATEPVSAATLHRSRSLVGEGIAERLFADRVSRPVLTIARKRWLQERRVPRGLLIGGYMLLILPIVYLPILAAGEIPAIAPILLAFVCAAGVGLAFGIALLGVEYPVLSMTLTTVSGQQFVRGTILAGVAIGAPVTAVVTLILGLGSPLGPIEAIGVALASVVLCGCSVTLAAAIGMNVSYHDFWPIPIPLTSAVAYGEVGRMGFIRMGVLLALVGLVCLPAFVGYLSAFFAPVATALDIPPAVVRGGLLVLTTATAVTVSIPAYRRAVVLFDQYTLP